MLTRFLRLSRRVPSVRQLLTPARARTFTQFVRFGVVGAIGFIPDTVVVYALRHPLGLYGAGVAAYLVAATVTWALNRAYTFRHASRAPAHVQWAKFLVANLFGFVLNRGTYAILVTVVPLCAEQPVLAVAAGCLAGMFVNFGLTRRMVFR